MKNNHTNLSGMLPRRAALFRCSGPRLIEPPSLGRRSIGLLGGSFDPAHDGHRHVSLAALRLLDLDEVWWLVSPQNPIKSRARWGFDRRFAEAKKVASHPKIRVVDFENRIGANRTTIVVRRLQRMVQARFVFLMGADNLAQLHRWYRWQTLVQSCPLAVFDRAPFSAHVTKSNAALAYAAARIPEAAAQSLASMAPPAWVFLNIQPHPASSSALRQQSRASD